MAMMHTAGLKVTTVRNLPGSNVSNKESRKCVLHLDTSNISVDFGKL